MDILIHGDTLRTPELRHEIPTPIIDPLLYGEASGRAFALISVLERPDVRRLRPDVAILDVDALGMTEIFNAGAAWEEAEAELALRACREMGVTRAAVPHRFPLGIAERLRSGGVKLSSTPDLFADRRRVKNPTELEGIRRACRAAEAGAAAVARMLREGEPDAGGVLTDAEGPVTCERLRAAAQRAAAEHGASLDEPLAARGAQAAAGHEPGSGPVHAGEVVVVDLAPQDRRTACFADFTRSFVAHGTPDEELIAWHALCRDAHQRVLDAIAPGMSGREVWEVACEVFEAAGQPTQRTKAPGETLDHGFYHALGHGVGLEVHEHPGLGLAGTQPLVAGDVLAIEPGLYRPGLGGVRIEDLVLVTDTGVELLTDFPYDLGV